MATTTPIYGSIQTITLTLTSLASDVNLLAGRQSTARDQIGTDLAMDAIVGGTTMTGTSPTASRQIEIWAYGSWDGGTTYDDACTGTDGNLTLVTKSLLQLLTIIPTNATSNKTYSWGPLNIAQAFGGVIPSKWGLWVVHNTGVALNATAGNHVFKYYPIKYSSV